MTLLFVGGGTLGPVTPLLATAKCLARIQPGATFVWIGTERGPERELVTSAGMQFHALPDVKFPRYASLDWFRLPFAWMRVRRMADTLLKQIKPSAVITMGGYTAVPVVFSAAKMHIPCFAHQLDLVPGLTNKLIAKKCASVTTSFEYEQPPFGSAVSDEPLVTPTRFSFEGALQKDVATKAFALDTEKPIVLIFGGGTGSLALNAMVEHTRKAWLEFAQVIHVTGLGKEGATAKRRALKGYAVRSLLNEEEMLQAYSAADIVVSRAGVGTLSEIAALKKASILIPLPDSPQNANAKAFEEQGSALVMDQEEPAFEENLLASARLLLKDTEERQRMGERAHDFFPTDDGKAFAEKILAVLEKPTAE
ncbi:MAG: UDP-N-acetylglucosamine--N-acetylmuramyl-(pentapeptide) pyrophosphoryl-undecaprenol N-acetylglucosamine transferase [Patescibacteria group bacterium]